jgi:class 3 adenylate cyclase/tetratricopeptide (TPR) repeat protein
VSACENCGRVNPDDARFCASCGSALSRSSRREVRKIVTVLFADVAGSTALGEQLDPESLRAVMARYFETARACLERHGGTVEKFIGDAVMAVFGVPTVHDDDALRAARAACELQESVARLNEDIMSAFGVSLQVRVGVNTGEVVVGTEERLATGDAVNVAARLEQAAAPAEILLGEETFRLARHALVVDPAAPVAAKGKADPIIARRLLGVREGAEPFERRFDAPFVGRATELGRIRSIFEQTLADRRCRLVTVVGPPGIGKTRLARQVSAELRDRAVVLMGRCLPYGDGITYWPMHEIFVAAAAEDELESALAAGGSEEIFVAVRKAVERRAREQPLALVVEDIHWAEPTLLDLVEHLTDWTRDVQLLVLCLARPELLDDRPSWGGDRPNAKLLTLDPLEEDEVGALVTGLTGDSALADDARLRILAVAEGNPLFVEQLVAAVAEGADAQRVPSTIQALLASRLDTLSTEERDVLECASVVGLEFEWDALAQLAADGHRPPGSLLFGLVRKELIRPHEAIGDTFWFRHMLVRDAAYERISKERRADLHERVADWLEGRGGEFDEIVGYHLEQAHRCLADLGPPTPRSQALGERAAVRLAASGRQAHARGDSTAASNLLERAATLFAPDDPRRLELLPTLGRTLREAARMDDAERVLVDAVRAAESAGDPGLAADARVGLIDIRFHRPAQTGVRRDDVLRELECAIPVFERVGDDAALARALTLRGKLHFWYGEAEMAREFFERAARLAQGVGDRAEEAESLQYVLATMHRGRTPVGQAVARFDELRSRTRMNRRLEAAYLETRAHLEAMQANFEVARELVREAIAVAVDAGLEVLLETHTRPSAGFVELLAGDAVAAEAELRLACEETERVGELGFLSSITPMLIDAVYAQGRYEEALALSDRWPVDRLTAPTDVDAQAGWRRVRAKALARLGRFEEAERLAREAVAILADKDYVNAHADTVADLGEVLLHAGRPSDAATAVREAIHLYELKGNVASASALRGRLAESPVDAL